jgi:hypothetical protein
VHKPVDFRLTGLDGSRGQTRWRNARLMAEQITIRPTLVIPVERERDQPFTIRSGSRVTDRKLAKCAWAVRAEIKGYLETCQLSVQDRRHGNQAGSSATTLAKHSICETLSY